MKILFLAVVCLFVKSQSFGQNIFPGTGNTGIGTLTPTEKLYVVEEGLLRPTFESISTTDYHRTILDFKRSRGVLAGKLPVVDNDKLGSIYFNGYDGTAYVETSALGSITQGEVSTGVVKAGLYFSTNDGTDMVNNYPKIKMYITPSGNVLINPKIGAGGNLEPGSTVGDGKLQVRGNIRAKEIKVEIANWPDYVFAKGYELPSLQETEKQIKEQGHLPGMPSAAEVKSNGVDLGDMNAKLLKKIEELTLYLIEQDRMFKSKLSDQQKEIDELKSKFK